MAMHFVAGTAMHMLPCIAVYALCIQLRVQLQLAYDMEDERHTPALSMGATTYFTHAFGKSKA